MKSNSSKFMSLEISVRCAVGALTRAAVAKLQWVQLLVDMPVVSTAITHLLTVLLSTPCQQLRQKSSFVFVRCCKTQCATCE